MAAEYELGSTGSTGKLRQDLNLGQGIHARTRPFPGARPAVERYGARHELAPQSRVGLRVPRAECVPQYHAARGGNGAARRGDFDTKGAPRPGKDAEAHKARILYY